MKATDLEGEKSMKAIETERLVLRNFEENDYDDLFEFLSRRKNDKFESYPQITYENGGEHLAYRLNKGIPCICRM